MEDPCEHLRALSYTPIQKQVADVLSGVICGSTPGYLIVFLFLRNGIACLEFFPVSRVTLIVGF
jgi:hypothetical protein